MAAWRGVTLVGLGLLAWPFAAVSALGGPFVAPIVHLDARLVGAEAGIQASPADTRVALGVGWGFDTQQVHWRLQAGLPVGWTAAVQWGYQDWPDVYLLGQVRELGLEAAFAWEPALSDRVEGPLFYGRVGQDARFLGRRVIYGWLHQDARLLYAWPFEVRARTWVMYGQAAADSAGAGWSGSFYAFRATLPMHVQYLRIIPRVGYSAGESGLPGLRFRLGSYGDGWLRGYGPGAFSGPVLLNASLEYRRPWLEAWPVPVIAQLEAGPFVDAGTTARHGAGWSELEWHFGYGLTAALPLPGILLGLDLARNDRDELAAGLRMSGEF